MITAIIFIVVLSVLVFVHELGHFLTAKKAGMKVEEFGFGFPPRLLKYKPKKSETIYSINAIPFGGFVKILGENDALSKESTDKRSFSAGSFWAKMSVIVSGVLMNVALAVVLFSIINMRGARMPVEDPSLLARARDVQINIVEIAKDSPAADAKLQPWDQILGFRDGSALIDVYSVEKVQSYINEHRGEEITLFIMPVDRDDWMKKAGVTAKDVKLTPRRNPPEGQGALGITLARTGIISYPWYEAIGNGFKNTWYTLSAIGGGFWTILKNLFTTGRPGMELAGPIGIAVVTGQAARLGFNFLLQFVAFISLNLAVLNILPFPALDGGRLLFIIIEKIKGSPLPKRVEAAVNSVGFILLIMLMIYATTKDVLRFF